MWNNHRMRNRFLMIGRGIATILLLGIGSTAHAQRSGSEAGSARTRSLPADASVALRMWTLGFPIDETGAFAEPGIVDVGAGQDLHIAVDGASRLVDRDSGYELWKGVVTVEGVEADRIELLIRSDSVKLRLAVHPSRRTHTGVNVEALESSGEVGAGFPASLDLRRPRRARDDSGGDPATIVTLIPKDPVDTLDRIIGNERQICRCTFVAMGQSGHSTTCTHEDCDLGHSCVSERVVSTTLSNGAAPVQGICEWISVPRRGVGSLVLALSFGAFAIVTGVYTLWHQRKNASA